MPIHKINPEKYERPSDYVNFLAGQNQIRILTEGGMFKYHALKKGKRFVPLGICAETVACKFCNEGNEPKTKYRWIVFDYRTEQIKLLHKGTGLGDMIAQLDKKLSKEGKRAKDFDLTVYRQGEGLQTEYAVDIAKEQRGLSEELLKALEPAKKYFIKKYLTENA